MLEQWDDDESTWLSDDDLEDWMCPNCGWDSDGEDGEDIMFVSNERYTNNPSLPVDAKDWDETWTCPDCGHSWTFENSNY